MTWGTFPGGELDGKRPKILCPACRERARNADHRPWTISRRASFLRRPRKADAAPVICFACYRAELEFLRGESMAEASHLQGQLPLEPVNHPRLAMLKMLKAECARVPEQSPAVQRRRRAQIAARHALAAYHSLADATHPLIGQLPLSWLPFVVSR